jgi:hypothetical protein
MESGDYYDGNPENFTQQFPDRSILKTPELDAHQPELTDISPPRPWERTASIGDIPPKSKSPYEQRIPAPPRVPSRQKSISPISTRSMHVSPKKDMDRSQTYPSRKPPSHLKFPMSPVPQSTERTEEEEFHLKRGGCPIVSFGFGGRMITMIPRVAHRVNVRGTTVPGPITFSRLREIVEPPGLASSFPGPLFIGTKPVKGKAKDVGKWVDDNIAVLERIRSTNMQTEDLHRIEDRTILYKLVKLVVENNGVLDGRYLLQMVTHSSPEVEKSVRGILLPEAANVTATEESEPFGVTASSLAVTATSQSTAVDPSALATYNLTSDFLRSIRLLLMQGDRQGAIRKAVDQKMWGHALLIASSVSQIVWRETVEMFVRTELRDTGSKDFDSLRFLYGVLGGEGNDAVNELLPPMNRIVSSIHSANTTQAPRFASWTESLGMVLLNKGAMDEIPALIGLGSALVNEGRVEAGHTW